MRPGLADFWEQSEMYVPLILKDLNTLLYYFRSVLQVPALPSYGFDAKMNDSKFKQTNLYSWNSFPRWSYICIRDT